MNEKIFEQVQSCRKQKNMSIKDLSEKANISYNYLYLLEKGKKNNPSLKTISKIANSLDMELTLLFTKKD